MRRAPLVAVAYVVGAACGAARGDLPVRSVPGAIASAAPVASGALGRVVAIVTAGDEDVAFGTGGVATIAAGVVTASDSAHGNWVSAARVPAPDEGGDWIVGVSASGAVWRVRRPLALENVSARFGLSGRVVRSVAVYDAHGIVFALDRGIAVADGRTVVSFDVPAAMSLTGGAGRIAGIFDGVVRTFEPAGDRWAAFPLRGATSVAIDASRILWVATSHALYRETNPGRLALTFTTPATIRSLFAFDRAVTFRAGDAVVRADATGVAVQAISAGSTHGRVVWPDSRPWLLESGAIARLDPPANPATRATAWSTVVSPVFHRACVPCHLPGGAADVDLSSANAWLDRRSLIDSRVVHDRSMPPTGHALSDDDRAAISRWISASTTH